MDIGFNLSIGFIFCFNSIRLYALASVRIRLYPVICVRLLPHHLPASPRGFAVPVTSCLILFVRPLDRRIKYVVSHADELIVSQIRSVHQRVE